MKDMFDFLEEIRDEKERFIALYKKLENKKRQNGKLIYFSYIDCNSKMIWSSKPKDAAIIEIGSPKYEQVKMVIRERRISCQIIIQPTGGIGKKKTWWDRVKVWFSRKVYEFLTIPVDSS